MQTVLFYTEKIGVFIKTQNNFRKILQCKTVLSRAKF